MKEGDAAHQCYGKPCGVSSSRVSLLLVSAPRRISIRSFSCTLLSCIIDADLPPGCQDTLFSGHGGSARLVFPQPIHVYKTLTTHSLVPVPASANDLASPAESIRFIMSREWWWGDDEVARWGVHLNINLRFAASHHSESRIQQRCDLTASHLQKNTSWSNTVKKQKTTRTPDRLARRSRLWDERSYADGLRASFTNTLSE